MNKKRIQYNIFKSYCIRTPFFPINFYNDLTNDNEISDEKFHKILNNSIFNEALYITSPELYSQIEKWCIDEIKDTNKEEKIKLAILKYATRISTRCTPFGLFAACGHGKFSKETKIEITSFKRFSRFDIGYLSVLSKAFLKNKNIKNNVSFYTNSSLYKIGNQYRYIKYELKDNLREYYLDGFNTSEYLDVIIDVAKTGKSLPELVELLLLKEIDYDEVIPFINTLINEQILVSELELSVTGKHYHQNLIEILNKASKNSKTTTLLKETLSKLESLDTSINNKISSYEKICNKCDSILNKEKIKNIFQVDCFINLDSSKLNKIIQKKLVKTLNLFNKISLTYSKSRIDEFKIAFLKRYAQSEVPLTIALDSETGVGYGNKMNNNNSLINDISANLDSKKYKEIIWTEFDELIQRKLFDVIKSNKYTLNINYNDVEPFEENWEDLPDTFSSIIEVYNNEVIYMNGAGGSTALNLIGRFCYGSIELTKLGNQIVKIENEINNNKIIAEIVHVPQHRTVNILHRPSLRKYEIPYLAKPRVDEKYQISINDIYISIKNNRILLRSNKLNKEVIPKLSNAHNFNSNTLPIYQFLCELQTQNKRNYIGFSWNRIFINYPFVPRVEFEGVIISKAKWNVKILDFKKIVKSNIILNNIREYRKKTRLPRLVQLIDGDNKLLINLENITSIKMLYYTVKSKKIFQLEEFLFDENGIVRKNNTSFCNQFVVSFYKDSK